MNGSYISPFSKPIYVMLKPVGSVCNLAASTVITWKKGNIIRKLKPYPDGRVAGKVYP